MRQGKCRGMDFCCGGGEDGVGVVAACWSVELGLPVARLSAASDFRALSGDSLVALHEDATDL